MITAGFLLNFLVISTNFNQLDVNVFSKNNVFWKILFFLNNSNFNLLLIIFVFTIIKLNKNIMIKLELFIISAFVSAIFFLKKKILIDFFGYSVINTELFNGVLLIHPLLTYISIVLYTNLYWFNKNVKTPKTLAIKNNCLLGFSVSSSALILGSLWAQQELNWGGWWNWDSVEIILLSLCILLLTIIHLKQKKKIYNYINIFFFRKYLYLLVFYFIVRSNFINSVHTFSVSSQIQKYFYMVVCITLVSFLFSYVFFKNFKLNVFKFSKKLESFNNSGFYINNINSIVVSIIYLSAVLYVCGKIAETNYFLYVSIFLKITVFFVFVFFKKKQNLIKSASLCCVDVGVVLNYIIINNIFTKYFAFFKEHVVIVLILFFTISNYEIIDNHLKINSLVTVFDTVYYVTDFLKMDFQCIKYSITGALNKELNITTEKLNQVFVDFLKNGTYSGFFAANILNSDNSAQINYVLDSSLIALRNYGLFLFCSFVLLMCFFLFFLLKMKKNTLNGIV